MFYNIGSKIQTLAVAIFIIGIVISVIVGLGFMEETFIGGLLIAIMGCLCSWIVSLFAYGFGELIEKTTEIAENTRCSNATNETISNNHDEISSNNPKTKKCPHCGIEHDFDDSECPNCGYQRRIIQKGNNN